MMGKTGSALAERQNPENSIRYGTLLMSPVNYYLGAVR